VRSTRGLRPLRLVWFEEFATKQEAVHREFSLKNGRTRRKTIEAMLEQFPPELLARFEADEAALSRESHPG
jgi:predicted GIY-YIG superfamily endonuclease